jgi:NADPH-dependent 7-cyano-7-deazaguanine reductase QueF
MSGKPKFRKYRISAEATVEVMNMNAKDVHEATWLTLYGDSIERSKITIRRVRERQKK